KFSLDNTVKYLGIYFTDNTQSSIPEQVWNKTVSKLNRWQEYFKSAGTTAPGRFRLLNTYITSSLTYHLFFDTPTELQIRSFDKITSRILSRNNIPHSDRLLHPHLSEGG